MIPTLHNWEDIAYFNTFGLGAMSEVIDCTVTEARNGEFDLVMTYPVTGSMYDLLENGKIIMASHDATKNQTAFSIYRIESNIGGIVTIYAHHLTYDLNYVLLRGHPSYIAGSTVQAIVKNALSYSYGGRYGRLNNQGIEETAYYVQTNINRNIGQQYMPGPTSLRNYVLDIANENNAEIVWGPRRAAVTTGTTSGYVHRYTYILDSRGIDSGATIRYGGNLTAAEKAEDVDDTYGRVYPYWKTDDGEYVYYNSEYKADAEDATKAYLKNFKYLDMSQDFDAQPTSEQKTTYAQAFLDKEQPYIPTESITINFSPFQDVGYDYDADVLQDVCLCDWVNLEIDKIGVSKKVKVIKTVYDTLMDRYKSLTIGEVEKSFAETVQDGVAAASDSGSDSGGGGTPGAINYSTGETATGGKWIDGKPIYRYTTTFTTTSTSTSTIYFDSNALPSDWDTIINIYGTMRHPNGHAFSLNVSLYNSFNVTVYITAPDNASHPNSIAVRFNGSAPSGEKTFYVTVEYTKAS